MKNVVIRDKTMESRMIDHVWRENVSHIIRVNIICGQGSTDSLEL